MYYVYILKNTVTNKLYKGCTEDLRKRLIKHNSQKVRSTKSKGMWKLLYYEAFINKTDALREEIFFKTGKGQERISYLLKNSIQ